MPGGQTTCRTVSSGDVWIDARPASASAWNALSTSRGVDIARASTSRTASGGRLSCNAPRHASTNSAISNATRERLAGLYVDDLAGDQAGTAVRGDEPVDDRSDVAVGLQPAGHRPERIAGLHDVAGRRGRVGWCGRRLVGDRAAGRTQDEAESREEQERGEEHG